MNSTELRTAIARKCPTRKEQVALVEALRLDVIRIAFHERADLTAFAVMEEARKQGRSLEQIAAALDSLAV